jgi:hypothetical protein
MPFAEKKGLPNLSGEIVDEYIRGLPLIWLRQRLVQHWGKAHDPLRHQLAHRAHV